MMNTRSLGVIVRAALLAGLAAGLTVAIFHFLATEPIIEQAIALEEQRHADEPVHEAPVVSRDFQRVGLFIGFLIYASVWALLLAVTYHIVQRWLPGHGTVKERFLLAAAAYPAVGLLPALKYPANPPGVGDPETIGYRQSLYLGFLALSILGTALAPVVGRNLNRGNGSGGRGTILALIFLGIFDLVIFAIVPNNLDPIEMPLALVMTFRVLSLVGLALFWTVLGVLFGLLLRQPGQRASRPTFALGR